MDLSVYIKQLLYRYDCVVVPGFGGFITNLISSQIKDDFLLPPSKKIGFNSLLNHNDGLLAHHIANELQCDYQNALWRIQKEVVSWQEQLKQQSLFLQGIGMLWLNEEKKIIFKPLQKVNYHMDSYGLAPCKVEKIHPAPKNFTNEKKHIFHLRNTLKYAAGFLILLATAIFLHQYGIIKTNATQKKQSTSFLNTKKKNKTFTKKIVAKKYYIVLGAFRNPKNIANQKKRISNKGFKPKILPTDKKGIFMVTIGGLNSQKKAMQLLNKAKKIFDKDAWIFSIKK